MAVIAKASQITTSTTALGACCLVTSLGATPQHLPWLQDKEHFLGKLDVQSQAHPGLELDLSLNLHQMTLEFLLSSKRIGNPLP